MKNVLCLARYEELGSSSRVRFYQYFNFLSKVSIRNAPLLTDEYIKKIYSGRKISLMYLVNRYLRRFALLLKAKENTLWIEKELFPMFPFWIENIFYRGRRVIVDYDDATFHIYDNHPNKLVRFLLGNKIDKVMRRADVVIAGNSYIRDRAASAGAREILIVPSAIDIERYEVKKQYDNARKAIGWLGSPSSQSLLESVFPVLEEVSRLREVDFIFVGVRELPETSFRYQEYNWSLDTEVSMIQKFDIGIMPVEDKPFQHGKCGFKLIQYLACGVPIVGSPIGVNKDIIIDGKNGYSAISSEDWVRTLLSLIDDSEKCKIYGVFGRQQVVEHFCIQALFTDIEKALIGD